MVGSRFPLLVLLSAGLLAAAGGNAAAQQPLAREYGLKAAYLYKFGKYVRWPADTADPFVIGVLGRDPFGATLREVERVGTVGGKRIVVHRFSSMVQYKPCQILFVSRIAAAGHEGETAEDRLNAALAKTQGTPVLLVSDTQGFARKGVVINFLVQANLIRMEINQDAAQRAGLAIAAPLLGLNVVTIVRDNEPEAR
jgi:hypothetical protein